MPWRDGETLHSFLQSPLLFNIMMNERDYQSLGVLTSTISGMRSSIRSKGFLRVGEELTKSFLGGGGGVLDDTTLIPNPPVTTLSHINPTLLTQLVKSVDAKLGAATLVYREEELVILRHIVGDFGRDTMMDGGGGGGGGGGGEGGGGRGGGGGGVTQCPIIPSSPLEAALVFSQILSLYSLEMMCLADPSLKIKFDLGTPMGGGGEVQGIGFSEHGIIARWDGGGGMSTAIQSAAVAYALQTASRVMGKGSHGRVIKSIDPSPSSMKSHFIKVRVWI